MAGNEWEVRFHDFTLRLERQYPLICPEGSFGILAGEGHWPIIEEMFFKVQEYLDNNPNVKQVRVSRIFEIDGGLEVKYSGGDSYVRGVFAMANAISYRVCSECGDAGLLREKRMRVYCYKHAVVHGAIDG